MKNFIVIAVEDINDNSKYIWKAFTFDQLYKHTKEINCVFSHFTFGVKAKNKLEAISKAKKI